MSEESFLEAARVAGVAAMILGNILLAMLAWMFIALITDIRKP